MFIASYPIHSLAFVLVPSFTILFLTISEDLSSFVDVTLGSVGKWIELSGQRTEPFLDALLSHYEFVLFAAVLLYFFVRSLRMLFLYSLQLIEFVVRVLRFVGDLLSELFWVNPRFRINREFSYRSDTSFTLVSIFARFVKEVFLLPIDWIRSLGINGVFGPDPLTESKHYRKTAFYPSLLQRLLVIKNKHITVYFFLSMMRLFVHRFTLPAWFPGVNIKENSHGDEFPVMRQLHLLKRHDVEEVLERSEDFRVVYGPRMCDVTQNGHSSGNFLLGMQSTSPTYIRDISNMRLIFRRDDVHRCRRIAADASVDSFLAFESRVDVLRDLDGSKVLSLPKDLVLPVIKSFIEQYFGVRLPLQAENADGTTEIDFNFVWFSHLFNYIFYDLNGDDSREAALASAVLLNQDLDRQIAAVKQQSSKHLEPANTVLARCLRLQDSGTPGMDDLAIRINLTGFLVGAVLPLINTICQVIDELISRPRILEQAVSTATSATEGGQSFLNPLQGFVLEALRFSPGDPVIYRHCKTRTELVSASCRSSVSANTLVMAWNSSAMFDPKYVDQPWQFNPTRPPRDYLHFGHMYHVCAGKYIVMSVIPAIVQELLSRYELFRIPGARGYPVKHGIMVSGFDVLVRPRGSAD